jgi:DNA-binding beta-propeller fold protein YncE
LWSLDPTTKDISKVVGFTDALGLTGIAEVAPDVFVIAAGNSTTKDISYTPGTWGLWKVDLTGATPQARFINPIPEADFLIGITPFNNDTVFIADAGKGALYQLSVSTGAYSVILQDPTMKAASGAFAEGLHGLKYHGGYVYYTNTFGNGFYKVQIDPATGKTTGSPVVVIAAISNPEDFAIGPDGSAFVATIGSGILKVTTDGNLRKVADVASASSVVFGRGATDRSILYVSTSAGTVSSIVAI